MMMVGVENNSLQTDPAPKSVSLVSGLAATRVYRCPCRLSLYANFLLPAVLRAVHTACGAVQRHTTIGKG